MTDATRKPMTPTGPNEASACEAALDAIEALFCDIDCTLEVALRRQEELLAAVELNITAIKASIHDRWRDGGGGAS